jgi:branched-chain amino acid transport system substrate-binding protein
MKNLVRTAAIVIAVCLIAASMASAAKKEIKIGGLFALSGKAAQIGVPTKAVTNMVIADINRKGGIKGAKLVLVPTDTLSEPGQAVVALKKLIARENVVAIVGPTTTGEAMACIPTLEEAKIPAEMCVGGAAPVVPIRPYVFKSPQKSSSAVARIYMYLRDKKIKKIALLTATDKFGEEGEQLLKELAPNYKLDIVAHEKFSPMDQDMSVQIGKIAAAKPQAMVVWTIGPAGGLVTKNARQLKVPFLIVQCHGQPDPLYLKVAGAAANGTVMPSTRLMVADQLPNSDPQKKVCLAFVKQYKALGVGEYGTHSGYAWDAVQIIANAMKKAGTDPQKLRAAIENTKHYVGVSGIYNLSAKDHTGLDSGSLVMVEVVNGKWKLIK